MLLLLLLMMMMMELVVAPHFKIRSIDSDSGRIVLTSAPDLVVLPIQLTFVLDSVGPFAGGDDKILSKDEADHTSNRPSEKDTADRHEFDDSQ